MIRQLSGEKRCQTRGRGLVDVTSPINDWLAHSGLQEGVLTLFLQHTSASLTIQENADPDVLRDLDNFFSVLVPDGAAQYTHTAEGPDDMPAHIRASLTDVSLSIPVFGGRMCLGTWQGVYIFEHRTSPHIRTLALNFIGE
ncbi:MAG: YjbQ family protein [Sneathiella sp.]|nr:YjbQ family protein [Sneathiella sp.]